VVELHPDLVIVDFLWGNDDRGWRFLQELKVDPRTKSIPMMLCTSGIQEARELEPQLTAMNIAVVYEPFDIDDLLDVVRRQLGTPISDAGH
jgi:CheY-like chemotaxis protein